MLSATAHIILVYCCHHFHDNQLKLNVRKCTKWVSDLDGYPANTPNTLTPRPVALLQQALVIIVMTMVVVMVVMMMLVVMLRMAALWTSPVGDLGDDDHVNACDDSVVECWWLNMDCDVIQPIFSDDGLDLVHLEGYRQFHCLVWIHTLDESTNWPSRAISSHIRGWQIYWHVGDSI